MKKQVLALAIVLSSITATFANNNPFDSSLKLSQTETSFIVDVSVFGAEVKFVTIVDSYGNLIFTDKIKPNKERIKYVLDKLQAGTYTVKVKGDKIVEHYIINHNGTNVNLVEQDTYSSPTIVKKENKIIVKSTDLNNNELRFSIFNSAGESIYTYDGFSQMAFNLNELDSGNYRVVVRNNEVSEELFVSI